MTIDEMSVEFDILYENISSGAAPNLNEYEKSLFLTRAQDELVRMYYNGKNAHYDSFESNEEVRRYLDTLITTENLNLSSYNNIGSFRQYKAQKPKQLMYVIREYATNGSNGCFNGSIMQVTPVIHEDLNRVLNDPFKRPNERKVLRYDNSVNNNVDFIIITKYAIGEYTMVYLKKPKPLIVDDLGGLLSPSGIQLTIEGEEEKTNKNNPQDPLDIPELLQRKVINRAVELAKATYVGDLNTTFAVNARDL